MVIKIKRENLILIFLALTALILVISVSLTLPKLSKRLVTNSSENRASSTNQTLSTNENKLKEKFAILSTARTNLCAGHSFIDAKSNDDSLQGSCCSAMVLHRYAEQVEGLKKYSLIEKIPSDPYDIPVSLARELLAFQKSITLTAEQQEIYDEAMKLSDEGGPCCCKCWRWDAFEGLAKHLITQYNFKASQIAEVWNLEDGCGGSGHEHGEAT